MSERKLFSILGDGQLGRMTVPFAKELGYDVAVLGNAEPSPAGEMGARVLKLPFNDRDGVRQLVQISDITTIEIEHVPADVLQEEFEKGNVIRPWPETILAIQDKLIQKEMLQKSGIPVAPFSADLDESNFVGGGDYIVKSRRGGFDGRQNLRVTDFSDPKITEKFLPIDSYAEQVIDFDKELSVIAARSVDGQEAYYPTVETEHERNICQMVTMPAIVSPEADSKAQELARDVMKVLKGPGIFAIEMFLKGDDVMVNEIAPRVHNSGHLTLQANVTSQFEQSVRAAGGLPLGNTSAKVPSAVMVNILGRKTGDIDLSGIERVLSMPNVSLNLYNKAPKIDRKLGHLTLVGASRSRKHIVQLQREAQSARDMLTEL